jgi:hypothetical protein
MGNMLEAPNKGDWGLYVREEYFDLIEEAGSPAMGYEPVRKRIILYGGFESRTIDLADT